MILAGQMRKGNVSLSAIVRGAFQASLAQAAVNSQCLIGARSTPGPWGDHHGASAAVASSSQEAELRLSPGLTAANRGLAKPMTLLTPWFPFFKTGMIRGCHENRGWGCCSPVGGVLS